MPQFIEGPRFATQEGARFTTMTKAKEESEEGNSSSPNELEPESSESEEKCILDSKDSSYQDDYEPPQQDFKIQIPVSAKKKSRRKAPRKPAQSQVGNNRRRID